MEWLNYHHLRYFWCVAKEGGLRKAAARLNVSEPSVSAQVRELEEALGEKLFQRVGRRNVLTDAGRIAFGYAEEIFGAGREMLAALKQRPGAGPVRLAIGVTDALPKLVTYVVLRPVLAGETRVDLVCSEGKMAELVDDLAAHRIDILLADETAPSTAGVRVFNHPLGECGVSFCAGPGLAATLRRGFPRSLGGAPALLPLATNPLRRSLEAWFRSIGVAPRRVAEFEDSALMKLMAAHQEGFIALPLLVVKEACERYGLEEFGRTDECTERFYAITAERRITHPLVAMITKEARDRLSRPAARRPTRRS